MRSFTLLKEAVWPGTNIRILPGTTIALPDDTASNVLDKFTGFPDYWQENKPEPEKRATSKPGLDMRGA